MNISIAMATFNGAKYINEQLLSLAHQELLPHELVAVDDGSSDETVLLLREFSQIAPFPVRIYQNEFRLGYGMNFLKAAALCTGDAISFCDQDDFWLPAKLSCVGAAMSDRQADFVAHSADVTDSHLIKTGQRYPDICLDAFWDTRDGGTDFFPGFAITISQNFFASIQLHLEQRKFTIEAHDELICELATAGWKRYELSESLVQYRQHIGNLIGYHGITLKKRSA